MTKTISMKWLNASILAALLIIATSDTRPPAASPEKRGQLFVSHYENVLGTSMELKVLAPSEKEASLAEKAALKEIARLGRILSGYDTASEFCHWLHTSGQPVKVSPELFEVLNLFDEWRIRTGGALDASAEVITRLWRQAATRGQVPDQQELARAVAEVQQPHWRLDPANQTATHLSQAPLMLNSFAKSYIIRRAADAAMAVANARATVVNIGGDLVVSGDWKETVQISDPKADAENDAPIDRLLITNKAVATSGNYRRGEQIAGHWYSHIVDPRTGQPADAVISATVVAPVATDAGALATAFNVFSPDESIRLASGLPGVEYLIITRSGQRIASPGWHALEAPASLGSPSSAVSHASPTTQTAPIPSATAPADDFELVVNLEINMQKEGFTKRPYVAVWVENQDHAAVRTIAVWHGSDRYLPELKSWYLKYRGLYETDKAALSTVSSATRSPGKYTLKWDGKDDQGNVVKPGTYIIKIEATREHGNYRLIRQELDLNGTPQHIDLPGNVEIASASLDYRKRSVGN
jgi:thiamine biosynthesis lipoprotein ApbE